MVIHSDAKATKVNHTVFYNDVAPYDCHAWHSFYLLVLIDSNVNAAGVPVTMQDMIYKVDGYVACSYRN